MQFCNTNLETWLGRADNYLCQILLLKTGEMQIRRYCPFLERSLTSGNGALACDEWKAVPDIWRSSADKYGDRVAVVDPYHSPPSQMTYKQVKSPFFIGKLHTDISNGH